MMRATTMAASSLPAAALYFASVLAIISNWRVEAFFTDILIHHHSLPQHYPIHPLPRAVVLLDAAREQDDNNDNTTSTFKMNQHARRLFLLNTVNSAFLLSWLPPLQQQQVAWAAPPITAEEANNLGARTKRIFRPKPPKILRPRLDKDFAVLLMRTSYNVLDELDCVAMDQFQRDFFIIRQAEYEPYVQELGVGFVKQGDLADPYYFDFISFAQYAAINREITVDPPLVFEERQPIEVGDDVPQQFVSRIVRRDSSITNAMLPREHDRRVGMTILNRLNEVFGATPNVGLPETLTSPLEVLPALQQLVKLFLINGYAFNGYAVQLNDNNNSQQQGKGQQHGYQQQQQFCLSLGSPATLWGTRSLQQEGNVLLNDYLLKTAKVLVEQQYGYRVVGSSVKYEGTRELSYLTIQ